MDNDRSLYKFADLSHTQEGKELMTPASPTAPASTQGTAGLLLVGPTNTNVQCPFCFATVRTSTRNTVTARTHILALLCCGLCCCCLPYCMDSTRNTDHYCPSCKKYLGTYNK